MQLPFYDPAKTYEENFKEGPFGTLADGHIFKNLGTPNSEFLGHKVFLPFGIPAGTLLNSRFMIAAMHKGFDLVICKTVRSKKFPCNPWPNVVPIELEGDLKTESITIKENFTEPLSITNSFGVPSFDPDFWQPDLSTAVTAAGEGQLVIGSFQGTVGGSAEEYIKDFAVAAKLVKETGAKVLEVNLSCPNEGSNHLLCFDIERTERVVKTIKEEIGDTPLLIKITYFKDHDQLTELIKRVGKDIAGVSAINTISTAIYDQQGKQALPGEGRLNSGVGGAGIKWAGLDMVARLKALREQMDLKYSIIGIGGVAKPSDYRDYRSVGADAVMSATGTMWNPNLAQEIKAQYNG